MTVFFVEFARGTAREERKGEVLEAGWRRVRVAGSWKVESVFECIVIMRGGGEGWVGGGRFKYRSRDGDI